MKYLLALIMLLVLSPAATAQSWVLGYDFDRGSWYAAPAYPYYGGGYSPYQTRPYYAPNHRNPYLNNPYDRGRDPRDRCDHRNDYQYRDYRRNDYHGHIRGHR